MISWLNFPNFGQKWSFLTNFRWVTAKFFLILRQLRYLEFFNKIWPEFLQATSGSIAQLFPAWTFFTTHFMQSLCKPFGISMALFSLHCILPIFTPWSLSMNIHFPAYPPTHNQSWKNLHFQPQRWCSVKQFESLHAQSKHQRKNCTRWHQTHDAKVLNAFLNVCYHKKYYR